MASCNSWQYLVTISAKIFPRSWQDLAKILLRLPRRVDPGAERNSGEQREIFHPEMFRQQRTFRARAYQVNYQLFAKKVPEN